MCSSDLLVVSTTTFTFESAILFSSKEKSPENVLKRPFAAGLDKNGECIDAFGAMGFGFVEVGTVTPRPQAGNDKPRLFRLVEAEGIINRMGFNNLGVDNLVENVKKSNYDGILGINIGKNKDTPIEKGAEDYLICMEKVYQYAGYIAVNISSPNTPGLRSLQYGEALDDLLSELKTKQSELEEKHGKYVPLALKIAPDLSDDEISQICESLIKNKIDGVIATNTTLPCHGRRCAHAGSACRACRGGTGCRPCGHRCRTSGDGRWPWLRAANGGPGGGP